MMRFFGRMAPGSGAGDAGHFAAMRRPNATAEANVVESCLLRPSMRRGAMVSAAPSATDCGATAGLLATVSALLPSGVAAGSGTASPLAHAAMQQSETVNAA